MNRPIDLSIRTATPAQVRQRAIPVMGSFVALAGLHTVGFFADASLLTQSFTEYPSDWLAFIGIKLTVYRLLATAAVASWFVWLFHLARDVRRISPEGTQMGLLGLMGWWFVPLAQMVMPYVGLRQLYAAAAVPTTPRESPDVLSLFCGLLLFNMFFGMPMRLSGALSAGPAYAQIAAILGALAGVQVARTLNSRYLELVEWVAEGRVAEIRQDAKSLWSAVQA